MQASLVEAAVDVCFEALRGIKTHELAPVQGDERVLASPPDVSHALHFGNRLESSETQ